MLLKMDNNYYPEARDGGKAKTRLELQVGSFKVLGHSVTRIPRYFLH